MWAGSGKRWWSTDCWAQHIRHCSIHNVTQYKIKVRLKQRNGTLIYTLSEAWFPAISNTMQQGVAVLCNYFHSCAKKSRQHKLALTMCFVYCNFLMQEFYSVLCCTALHSAANQALVSTVKSYATHRPLWPEVFTGTAIDNQTHNNECKRRK